MQEIHRIVTERLPQILVDLSFAYWIVHNNFDQLFLNKVLLRCSRLLKAVKITLTDEEIKKKTLESFEKAQQSITSLSDQAESKKWSGNLDSILNSLFTGYNDSVMGEGLGHSVDRLIGDTMDSIKDRLELENVKSAEDLWTLLDQKSIPLISRHYFDFEGDFQITVQNIIRAVFANPEREKFQQCKLNCF